MIRVALVWVAALAVIPSLPSLTLADKGFTGRGGGGTWDCKSDPVVNINHGGGTYTFQGACKSINLNGGKSTLTIESTDQLNVTGASNTITVGEIDQINVVGANNTITWKKAKHGDRPGVATVGANNKIENGGGGAAAEKPAADKPAAKDKPRDRSAIDCAKQPNQSIDAGDGTLVYIGACDRIVINGGENRLTVESVKQLVINGSENVVDVGAVDAIQINGDENKVNYKKGVSGAKPRITSLGAHNVASQAK
jgi:hypothetical protein